MEWIGATFAKYPELAVFLVIGIGYWIGGFKIRGFGLGPVTGSLIVGLVIGYFFDVAVSPTAKSLLFLLFLFSIGYSVGPKFFQAMKGDGLRWCVLAIVTSVTGYGFPVDRVLPSHIVGAISLVALAIASVARYRHRLAQGWRKTYVVTAVLSLYLNVFVLIVQTFQKVPALRELAPTQSEPPFAISQLIVLVMFVVLGYRAVVSFREPAAARQFL